MPWIVGAAVVGSSIVGGVASKSAAKTQAGAADRAGQLSKEQFEQTREDLMPWQQGGKMALSEILYRLGLSPGGRNGTTAEAPSREQFTTRTPGQAAVPRALDPRSPGWGQQPREAIPESSQFDEAGYQAALQAYEQQQQGFKSAAAGDEDFGSLLKPFSLDDFHESPAYQWNISQGMEAINKSAAAKGRYYAPATLQDIGKYSQGLASNEFQNAFNNYGSNQDDVFSRLFGMSNSGQNAAAQTGTFGSQAAGQQGEAAMGAGNVRAAGTMGAANSIAGGVGDAYNQYLMREVLGQRQQPTYGVSTDMDSYGGGLRIR